MGEWKMWSRKGFIIGCVWGGILAVTYTILLLLLVPAHALLVPGGEQRLATSALPVPELVLSYLLGGVTSGAVIGVLHRHAHGLSGSLVVGFLAALPFLAAVRVAVIGLGDWLLSDVLQIVLRAMVMGTVFGAFLWKTGEAVQPRKDTVS